MRNLKRVLSLALAALMLMGMMVVGAGAASKDFTDASEIKNVEAVDVMVALGILEGGDKGDFQPNSILTREQAAKIICYLLLGPENAEKLVTSGNVFNDVAANRWSAPFIGYCVNLGILAGDGNGHFFPEGKLTGAAFAKMLLVALGYDPAIEKYTGNEWTINVAGDAIEAGIAPKGLVLTDELSRQDAAQMAFQTLTANMVKYNNKGTTVIGSDGMQVIVGASSAEPVTAAAGVNYNKVSENSGDTVLQFCEKYFSDLTKVAGDRDDFGRPADHKWMLKGTDEVFNATETAAYTVVLDKDYKTDDAAKVLDILKDLTGNKKLELYTVGKVDDVTLYIDGKNVSGQDNASKVVAGLVVELYCDGNTIKNIVAYMPAVGEVTKVSTNKDGDVTYYVDNASIGTNYADSSKTDTVVINGTVEKGDIVTVANLGSVKYVYPTTSFEGTQTASKTKDGITTVTIDGKTYTVSGIAKVSFKNSKDSANYYLDQFGQLVYTDSKAVASTDYAYIVGYNASLDKTIDGTTPYVEVRAVLSDGTVGVYQLATEKTDGKWYIKGIDSVIDADGNLDNTVKTALSISDKDSTAVFGYTLDGSVMTLETVKIVPSSDCATESVYYGSITIKDNATTSYTVIGRDSKTILVNNNTKFVAYDADNKTVAVYDGISKLPSKFTGNTTARVVATSGSTDGTKNIATASYVFLYNATSVSATVDTYVYIDATDKTEVLDADNKTAYEYTGTYADGTTVVLTAKTALSASGLYKFSEDNKVADSDKINLSAADDKFLDESVLTVIGDMVKVGEKFYYITNSTEIVYVDSDLSEVDGNKGIVVLEKDDSNNVAAIFVTAPNK